MTPEPRISQAEWDVMHVLWELEPSTAQEVHRALAGRKDWSARTVKTLLGRLVKKGVLGYEVDGPRYVYHSLVSREACLREESRSILERLGGRSISPLLAHFVEQGELSREEIAELKELLERREDEA